MALPVFASSNTLGSIPWAVPFGEREVQTMLGQAGEVLAWYDGMRRVVPTWYGEAADPVATRPGGRAGPRR